MGKKIISKDKKIEIKKTGGLKLDEIDKLILMIMYKVWWACDYHIALLIDEPVAYVRGRLKQMAEAGLIGRKYLVVGSHACNYILKKGMQAIDQADRRVRMPSGTIYHDLGEIDAYVLLCLPYNGARYVQFGCIITERDLLSQVSKKAVGKSINGKPVYKDIVKVHIPDGYIIRPEGMVAIEYERTLKSKSSTTKTENNYKSNRKKFVRQIWFCEKRSIMRKIESIRGESNDGILPMSDGREILRSYIALLPEDLSKKSGRIRKDNIGKFHEAIAVDKLPTIYDRKVVLER